MTVEDPARAPSPVAARGRLLLLLCSVVLLLVAVGAGALAARDVLGSEPAASPADGTEPVLAAAPLAPPVGPPPDRTPVSGLVDASAPDPVRVRIPRIGVAAPVGPLEVDADGVLAAPVDYSATGWWRDGPEPGEAGPAVLAGHVDDWRGPAVFVRLSELTPGDRVLVDRADGSTAEFRVTHALTARKDAFPTAAVYGTTASADLRLITCGGTFDRDAGSYLHNVVVFATRSA